MLGLPKTTELNKQLPKTAIYAKFNLTNAEKERIDRDISKIYIVNEVTPAKIQISPGENVKGFFVLHITLKQKDFLEKNIIAISKLIPQNMVMVLEFEDKIRIAVYHTKLLVTDSFDKDSFFLTLKGTDLDKVWENIIIQIGGLQLEDGNSLDRQIAINEQREKLQKEIDRLEKKARAEKQPKKKYALVQQIAALQNKLEEK